MDQEWSFTIDFVSFMNFGGKISLLEERLDCLFFLQEFQITAPNLVSVFSKHC